MRLLMQCLLLSLLCASMDMAYAARCEDITEQIKDDTAKYGDAIAKEHLPWMCLGWLQQAMGTPISKKSAGNLVSYTWECAGNSDSKLTVVTDNTQKLVQVEGQYSSERGAGVFSAAVSGDCEFAKASVINPSATTKPIANDSVKTTTCDATAEQIYDIAVISQDQPYTHTPYPWENKNWLEKTYGKPEAHNVAKNTLYTWHCKNDVMTTIAYSETPVGHFIQLTTLCKGSACYLATVSRDNNKIKGSLKPIEP